MEERVRNLEKEVQELKERIKKQESVDIKMGLDIDIKQVVEELSKKIDRAIRNDTSAI